MKCGIIFYVLFFGWSIFELRRGWKILVRGEDSFNFAVLYRLWLIDKFRDESDKEKYLEKITTPSGRRDRGCISLLFFWSWYCMLPV
jgi:hypothetical protein